MKELSIEEKAKAYDEALEKAKDYHKQLLDEDNPEWASKIENIFPKLKESREDEIIRVIKEVILNSVPYKINILTKDTTITAEEAIAWLEKQSEQGNNEDEAILHRFSFYSYKDEPNILYLAGLYVNDEYRNKGIGTKILKIADEVAVSMKCSSILLKTEIGSNAERLYKNNGYSVFRIEENQVWLEKQGEHDMGISEATKQKLEDNLNKALEKETPESLNKFLEEQSEQKTTIEMKTPEESLDIDSDTYNKIVDECIYGEQKPAEDSAKVSESSTEEKDMGEYKKGFECGKQRVLKYPEDFGLCKKSAWSEEDEAKLKSILFHIEDVENKDVIDWLKFLKERCTWKPSDEQMHYLSWIANVKLGDSIVEQEVSKHLNELLEDLKKLREE